MSMTYLTTMRDAAINAVKNGHENLILPKNISRQTCEMFVRSLNCELEPQFGASLELEDDSPSNDNQKMWMKYLRKRANSREAPPVPLMISAAQGASQ